MSPSPRLDGWPARSHPSAPFLVIELEFEWGMRVIPAELPAIHANLYIGNMDFGEFAESADAARVPRLNRSAAGKHGTSPSGPSGTTICDS
ncbi:DUF6924 domain-containing protein [Nonomuraea roseola]|uniref:DUF6924 domain-containing protein n=1 Tax=Nonomuraea roseola TaxID=46179 RepID=A0ABV5QB40_9ACTN